jgi:hypothetical protein
LTKLIKVKVEVEFLMAYDSEININKQIENSLDYVFKDISSDDVKHVSYQYSNFESTTIFDYPCGWNSDSIPYSENLEIDKTVKDILNQK